MPELEIFYVQVPFQQPQELRNLPLPLPPPVERQHVREGDQMTRSPKMNLQIGEPLSVSFPIGVGFRKAGFNCSVYVNAKENK